MVKVESASAENVNDFLESSQTSDALPPEEKLRKELALSKNVSISEIQRNLATAFGKKPEDLKGKTVDSFMKEVQGKVENTISNVSRDVGRNSPNVLTRKIWETGGTDVCNQITRTELSGINSVEMGTTYLDHLERAHSHASNEWEKQNEINQKFLTRKSDVKPFLGNVAEKFDWLGTMPSRIIAGGIGAIAGGSAAAIAAGISSVLTMLAASPAVLAGGAVGFLLPKYIDKLRAKHEEKTREKQRKQYEQFEAGFAEELEEKFKSYEDTARSIKDSGETQATGLADYIDAQIDLAQDDKEKSELIEHLVKVKKDPEGSLDDATKAFVLGNRTPDKQFKISFYEAVKKLSWVDNTVSVQRQLEHRAVQERTLHTSAKKQQDFFTGMSPDGDAALVSIMKSFSTLQDSEGFEGISPREGADIDFKDLLQDIHRDLAQEGKLEDLKSALEKKDMIESVGLSSATKMLFTLNHLFENHDELIAGNILSHKTKQDLLSWIKEQDRISDAGFPGKSAESLDLVGELEGVPSVGETAEKKGLIKEGSELLNILRTTFRDKIEAGEDVRDIKNQVDAFFGKLSTSRAKYDRLTDLPIKDKEELQLFFTNFESFRESFRKNLEKIEPDMHKIKDLNQRKNDLESQRDSTAGQKEKRELEKRISDTQNEIITTKGALRRNLGELESTFNDFGDTLATQGAVPLRERITSAREGAESAQVLYSRVKGALFREFEKDMTTSIMENWKANDPYEVLMGLEKKTGAVDVGYIDMAETLDSLSLPSDLARKTQKKMHITKNSNDKGIELENESGNLRIYLFSPIVKDNKTILKNARVCQVDRDGKLTHAREAVLTNLTLS